MISFLQVQFYSNDYLLFWGWTAHSHARQTEKMYMNVCVFISSMSDGWMWSCRQKEHRSRCLICACLTKDRLQKHGLIHSYYSIILCKFYPEWIITRSITVGYFCTYLNRLQKKKCIKRFFCSKSILLKRVLNDIGRKNSITTLFFICRYLHSSFYFYLLILSTIHN